MHSTSATLSFYLLTSFFLSISSFNATFYLIPTREGLAVQLISLNAVYVRVVSTFHRVLVIAPFTSNHYSDSGWIHLCDYFQLPDGIVCTSEKPADIVSRMPCIVDCSNKDWPCHKDPKVFLNPNFDLEMRSVEFPLISKGVNHFDTDGCGLYVTEDTSRKADWFRITPKMRYQGMFAVMKQLLFRHAGATMGGDLKYNVLHWRRGDQLTERCVNGIDSSINCMTTIEVVKYVKGMRLNDRNITSFLYIATNEGNTTILDELAAEGIYSWWTLSKNYSFRLKNIEMFIVELQLMIDANRFMRPRANFGWFSFASWIDQLVEIERDKNGKKSEVIDYP